MYPAGDASGLMDAPLDKIVCERKFYRYVVACMHNCPHPHFCYEFWEFFRSRGITPVEYYNQDGIGEKVMRRVVFDCDRCGKRDIQEVFGIYDLKGEASENRLDESERIEAALTAGIADADVTRLTYMLLEQIEGIKGWQHYCRRCFQSIAEHVAKVLKPPVVPSKMKKAAVKKVAHPVDSQVDAPPQPVPIELSEQPPSGKDKDALSKNRSTRRKPSASTSLRL